MNLDNDMKAGEIVSAVIARYQWSPGKPSLAHEVLIECLLADYQGSARKGFMRAVNAAIGDEIPGFRAIPDAFRVDHDTQCVLAFEVECTHRISREKMASYEYLAWELDEYYWRLILHRVNDRGEISVYDVQEDHLKTLIAAARERRQSGTCHPEALAFESALKVWAHKRLLPHPPTGGR